MLGSGSLVAFVPATDLARARHFYERTLGLSVAEDTPYACVFMVNGSPLRVTRVDEVRPPPYTVLGWVVSDLYDEMRALSARDVAFLRFDGMGQDDLGGWTAPNGDRVAWFKDPDGNTLSLTQLAGEAD
jgi:catechol 2,3-dioxygenase-like lactoylglutathione lyase family enzyme